MKPTAELDKLPDFNVPRQTPRKVTATVYAEWNEQNLRNLAMTGVRDKVRKDLLRVPANVAFVVH